ncbi:MAG: hypothetical protein HW390_3445 [Candidatus Brocadiaceae bacterium]|nr:hypothetical protein [Candidatus Brocadiaceae bacterium]
MGEIPGKGKGHVYNCYPAIITMRKQGRLQIKRFYQGIL